ncbi:hypothetical protein F7734_31660 [Scytonema sp. UIC 10036]|uniref:hypothetical protein n=1 Tax=Scytonema sp. UIC 10036 TaxID=2304196 RepID=UPI0012DA2B5F|nr:hypothetical protein [Scytonema sp. UIC 10036]MUG96652.1 hypothetical protein [Scytonema sp. UIC 10036]
MQAGLNLLKQDRSQEPLADWEKAALCYQSAKNWSNAARCYLMCGQSQAAADCWIQAGD